MLKELCVYFAGSIIQGTAYNSNTNNNGPLDLRITQPLLHSSPSPPLTCIQEEVWPGNAYLLLRISIYIQTVSKNLLFLQK